MIVHIAASDMLIIWYAKNPKDHCNLYYVVSLLQSQNIQVVECAKKTLNDRTFIYKWVGEVCVEDLPMLLKESKKLSEQEKMIYTKRWKELVSENGLLRAETSEGIQTVNEDYYDALILKKYSEKIRV